METFDQSLVKPDMSALREGIKNKYNYYHLTNKARFPALEYNTNRANYEPLRESFEEEFFVLRGIDRQQKTIHIPSTNTLSLLFTDDSYVPSQKIWNTCWSYAEEQAKTAATPAEATPKPRQLTSVRNHNWLLLSGTGLVVGLLIGIGVSQYLSALAASRQEPERNAQNTTKPCHIKIIRPISKSRIAPTFIVSGQATPGETIWLVTHFQDTNYYWVQFPILVSDRGFWVGAIEILGAGFDKPGKTHHLRAFINPAKKLRVSDVLQSWPEAECSTDIVEVIMDPKAGLQN